MTTRMWFGIAISLAILHEPVFCQQPSAPPELTEKLRTQLQSALKWSEFWRPGQLVNYVAGETIPVKVVASPGELVVFLNRIRMQAKLRRSGPDEWDGVAFLGGLSRIGNETPESDVQLYIDMQTRRPDPGSQRIYRGPALSPESFRVGDDMLQLPVLTPPEYVANRTPPPDVEQFIAAATRDVRQHLGAGSPPVTVVVPYFSADDPVVYVYVDFHQPESEGILHMVRDEDGWAYQKLSFNAGPNNFDRLISTIRSLRMAEFQVAK